MGWHTNQKLSKVWQFGTPEGVEQAESNNARDPFQIPFLLQIRSSLCKTFPLANVRYGRHAWLYKVLRYIPVIVGVSYLVHAAPVQLCRNKKNICQGGELNKKRRQSTKFLGNSKKGGQKGAVATEPVRHNLMEATSTQRQDSSRAQSVYYIQFANFLFVRQKVPLS